MRRRTAGLLGTGALLLMAGYVAWCSRPFYLKPRIVEASWIPEEVMAAIPKVAEAAGMMGTEKFSRPSLLHYLSHPYEKHTGLTITATSLEPDVVMVMRDPPAMGYYRGPSIYFIRRSGQWKQATELEYMEYRIRWNVDPWKKSSPPKGMEDLMNKGLSDVPGGDAREGFTL